MNLPPLTALRAFAAFAETGSVTAGGRSLNVTHAAISQQIRALEAHLGLSLVVREGKVLTLTQDGRRLADTLRTAFSSIADTVADLTRAEEDRPILISTTPSFASFWLMPRLASFRAAHPGVDLRIDPSPRVVDLKTERVDVAFRYGTGPWPGLDSAPLVMSPVVVVAAPSLVAGRDMTDAEALAGLPWLVEEGAHESTGVLKGARAGGVTQVPGHLLLMGVVAGQGVAATVRHFVEGHLADGSLIALAEEPGARGYHVVTAPGAQRPALRAFLKWVRAQARV